VDLSYLSRNAVMTPGQNVFTSGLGDIFPKGIPIGKVVGFHSVEFGLYYPGAGEAGRKLERAGRSVGAVFRETLNTILILLAAFVAVFLQAAVGTRGWLGAQIDLLPALIVYASLTSRLATVALLAVCGGLWFDSLSANPLGISILPLFVVGWTIHEKRELILRHQVYANSSSASRPAPLCRCLRCCCCSAPGACRSSDGARSGNGS